MIRKIVKSDEVINIPPDIAICPYCQGKLGLQVNSWTQESDGSWLADEIDLDCENETLNKKDIHNNMPYVYWLPVSEKVKVWLNQNYEFNMQDEAKKMRQWNKAILDWS